MLNSQFDIFVQLVCWKLGVCLCNFWHRSLKILSLKEEQFWTASLNQNCELVTLNMNWLWNILQKYPPGLQIGFLCLKASCRGDQQMRGLQVSVNTLWANKWATSDKRTLWATIWPQTIKGYFWLRIWPQVMKRKIHAFAKDHLFWIGCARRVATHDWPVALPSGSTHDQTQYEKKKGWHWIVIHLFDVLDRCFVHVLQNNKVLTFEVCVCKTWVKKVAGMGKITFLC